MEVLCREIHEGYGHKEGNGAGPLCMEEYYWGLTCVSADA